MTAPDVESMASRTDMKDTVNVDNDDPENVGSINGLLSRLTSRGAVELGGSVPVPYKERTVTQYFNIFSLWFCMSCNLLP